MTKLPLVLAGLAALSLAAAPAHSQSRKEEAHEKHIALSKVPKPAVDAAQKTLGATVTEAEIVRGAGAQRVYELSATDSTGKEHAVHVTGDGQVIKTETEQEGH